MSRGFLKKLDNHFKRLIGKYVISPIKMKYFKIKYNHIADIDKNITIKVKNINNWYRGNRYKEITFPGEIRGGDWSVNYKPKDLILNNSRKYDTIVQRYKDQLPWRETRTFKERIIVNLKKGRKVRGKTKLDDVEQFYIETYDSIFESIKQDGVLPATKKNPDITPIYVMIDEDGEILYTVDGNHRLFMCMVLGIKEMPVKVWMRHKKWQEIREHILGNNGDNIKEEYRKYLIHPDIRSDLHEQV